MTPSGCGFSPKQIDSIKRSTAKINIWEGSVRSGKTYISLYRFLDEIMHNDSRGQYVMLAKTYDTFQRNILQVLRDIIGDDVKYYYGKRELNIWGKNISVIGCDDETCERKIRGLTAAGAYVDEATIIPESMWRMLISRCAMGGARIFATTNPDSPYHWLKRDYLTDNPDVVSFQFRLEDNPFLEKKDADYLRRQYKGLWHQRFIQGLWVQADGAIYDFFDSALHVIDLPPTPNPDYYIMGVDYGTTNACCFTLIGISPNKYPNMWIEEEYYWDSKVKQKQKTDSEYAEDLSKMINRKNIRAIYIDPSAASFKLELQKQGVTNLYDAKNEVLDGIRMVASYMDNGALKICKCCKNLIDEIQGYVWDSKAAKTGKEKPLKQSDHACDALRYAIYTHFYQKALSTTSAADLDKMYMEVMGGSNLPDVFTQPRF
jgi:PBSX family phage terminase large subunit